MRRWLCALILSALPGAALADATTEAQLRAALQTATTQIAALEDQVANLQAEAAPRAALLTSLRAQLLAKQTATRSAPQNAASGKQLAAVNRELAAREAALATAQAAAAQAAAAAAAGTVRNRALTMQTGSLTTQLETCDTKNAELYKLGTQILDAYAHKDGVLAAFANHEPFIGVKRVQLQTIVQDDQDKLDDNQIAPGQ